MTWENPTNDTMKRILETAETIAVIGLSDNPDRTSYQIAKVMQASGYRIIPVNPTIDEVLGERAYPSVQDIPDKIDIINVFRRPEYLPNIAKKAALTNCKVFWAQQGIISEEAYHYLREHDFDVIMDRCIKVVHSVLVKS
jgi:predicted CoA-binding protein